MSGFLKGGRFKPTSANTQTQEETKEKETVVMPTIGGKPSPFGKKKLGTLTKKISQNNEEPKKEETTEETVSTENKVIKKKLGSLTKKNKEEVVKEEPVKEEEIVVEETVTEEVKEVTDSKEDVSETTVKETKEVEEKEAEPKKKTTRRTTKRTTTKKELESPEVDETRRVSIEEMDEIMRPIVAPTTQKWEEEKANVLEALNKIKIEENMTMPQVKSALSELDYVRQELIAKQHDAETMYDGTKKNYEAVKAIAIANGNATNAEGRKAEGILACKNYVTPSGDVVDLDVYMLIIEEKYKFYEKMMEQIDFKKYSLVNYNNALKLENRE